VTLFNGQSATVISKNETTVVADIDPPFAAALTTVAPSVQTVISGPMLNVVPIVSADRRFIQLAVQPIRAIQFPFPTSITDNGQPATIEFPIIQLSSIQTMVSVPDGGTILLGGLRRMSDGGIERGVPILNKVPYVNRLFRNAATIKDSQSLMLMVTPRIIIQEEEEQ
jgi:general secretion pathway protein D